jgi:hypothetical protein
MNWKDVKWVADFIMDANIPVMYSKAVAANNMMMCQFKTKRPIPY